MFINSFKSRITISITGIVLVSFVMTIIFLAKQTEYELEKELEGNSLNLLNVTKNYIKSQHKSIMSYKQQLLLNKKNELNDKTEIAFNIIKNSWQDYVKGTVSEHEAKEIALKFIREMRYDGENGYYWVMQDNQQANSDFLLNDFAPDTTKNISENDMSYSFLGGKENLIALITNISQLIISDAIL